VIVNYKLKQSIFLSTIFLRFEKIINFIILKLIKVLLFRFGLNMIFISKLGCRN